MTTGASNLQQYGLYFVTVNGPLLVQEQDVTVDRDTHATQVATVPLGFAGVSPGAAMCEISVTNAVPQAGFEFDAGPNLASLAPADVFVIGPGSKTLKGQVIIHKDNTSHGVNKAAVYSFQCWAPLAQWE